MKKIETYTYLVNELLEKERNRLEKINYKKNNRDIEELINKYDKELLEKYKFIEQYIDIKEQE